MRELALEVLELASLSLAVRLSFDSEVLASSDCSEEFSSLSCMFSFLTREVPQPEAATMPARRMTEAIRVFMCGLLGEMCWGMDRKRSRGRTRIRGGTAGRTG